MRRLLPGMLVLLALGAGGAAYFFEGQAEPVGRYRLARVEQGPVLAAVNASGTVNAVTTVQVGAQLSGQIRELLADFNTQVRAGQVIARLDPDQIEARLRQAEAELAVARSGQNTQAAQVERARADAENARGALASAQANATRAEVTLADAERENRRRQDLATRGIAPTSDAERAQVAVEQARASLAAARAQVQSADAALLGARAAARVAETQVDSQAAQVLLREAAAEQVRVDLERTVIRSPIDGVVVLRNVDVGQTVASSLQAPVLFTIAQDLRRMEVYASVDEADIGRIRLGQTVSFTVTAYPRDTFRGTVAQIRLSPQSIQNVVTYVVVISAENLDLKLLPGMTATVQVVIDRREQALKVPNAALRWRPAGVAAPAEGAAAGGLSPMDEIVRMMIRDLRLTAEQQAALEPIVAETRQQFARLRDQEVEPEERRRRQQAIRQAMGRRVFQILTPEQRPLYQQMLQARREQASAPVGQVWTLGPDGRPQAVAVRLGIGDGTATEVLPGQLAAGQEVVIGGGERAAGPGGGSVLPRFGF